MLNIEEQINQIANNSSKNESPEERQMELKKLKGCEQLIDEIRPSVELLEQKAKNIYSLLADSAGSTNTDLMDQICLTKLTIDDLTKHMEILKKAASVC